MVKLLGVRMQCYDEDQAAADADDKRTVLDEDARVNSRRKAESLIFVMKGELELHSSSKITVGALVAQKGNHPAFSRFSNRLQHFVQTLVKNAGNMFVEINSDEIQLDDQSQVCCHNLC